MLVLLLMVAGFAIMVGAKGVAESAARAVAGAALVLAIVPCLVAPLARLGVPAGPHLLPGARAVVPAMAFMALVVVGFVSWRRRAERERARELWARRHGSSRKRALPAAPPVDDEGQR
jgi:hypothetical protein